MTWYTPAQMSMARIAAAIEAGQQVHRLQNVATYRNAPGERFWARVGDPDTSPRKAA